MFKYLLIIENFISFINFYKDVMETNSIPKSVVIRNFIRIYIIDDSSDDCFNKYLLSIKDYNENLYNKIYQIYIDFKNISLEDLKVYSRDELQEQKINSFMINCEELLNNELSKVLEEFKKKS